MKQLVKGSSILTAVSIGEMLMRFVRTKCIALFLGTVGTGFLAQLALLFETLRIFGDLGARRAVIKQIAEQRGAGKKSVYKQVIKTSYFLVLASSLITSFIAIVFSPYISQFIFGAPDHYMYIIVAAFLLPLASLSTVTASVLKGNLDFTPYAKYTLMSYVIVMLMTPAIVYYFKYWGALIVYGMFFIFPLFGYLIFNVKTKYLMFDEKFNWAALKEQLSYGLAGIYQDSLIQLSRLIIAAWIIKELGFSQMGIFQVVITFSTVYLSIPINAIFGYSFPLIASASTPKDITRAINESVRFITFLLMPLIVLLMLWPRLFIPFFFSSEFIDAGPLLQVQLIGTLFLIIGFSFATALGAKGKIKSILVTSTLNPVLFIGFSWLFFDRFKLMGVSIAYTVMNIVLTLTYYLYIRNYFEMRISPKNQRLLIATAAWTLFAFWAGRSADLWVIKIFVLLLGIPWFFLSSKMHERQFIFQKLKHVRFRKLFSF